jgi:hypothetical protein
MLKAFNRQRKARLFFKSTLGATVADILSSLLITAHGDSSARFLEFILSDGYLS